MFDRVPEATLQVHPHPYGPTRRDPGEKRVFPSDRQAGCPGDEFIGVAGRLFQWWGPRRDRNQVAIEAPEIGQCSL
ncbi:hypothetical protein [Nocardia sienata]|uniref:hypothetical protein n=1 Tax=Nocardia sienata TaxID=248552 RepID=UPI0012ED8305|nr:hypothetical protein [Nocardia sienata]